MSRSTAPAQSTFSDGQDATLADVGRAVVRSWRWLVLLTFAVFAASVAFVILVTPRYTGEARLLLQAGDSYFTRPGNNERVVEQAPQIDEQAVASQVQVVMSRDLARRAIQKLGLVGNPEFDPDAEGATFMRRMAMLVGLASDPSARPPEDRVLDQYYDRLLVYPVGKSRIVAIEFKSKDPDLAARGANTVAELYLDLQEDAKKDQARSASTWLGSNIEALRKRVAEAEAKVEAFRSKTGLLVGSGTTTLSAQQLSELSAQLAQARTAQSDAQAKAKLIKDLIKDGRAFDIPDVANNELIRRLLEQRVTLKAQLALELRTLMPQHPRIKELNAQLNDLETQVRSAADRTTRTLENDARIAGGRVESLVAAVEAQKKVVAQANEGEVQLRALEREARTQREQLESYLGRFREASARDADYGMPPDARIVSRAIVPQIPSFPKKLPIVGLATIAAFVLAVGAIMARELLSSRGAAAVSGPVTYDMAEPHSESGKAPVEPSWAAEAAAGPERHLTFDLSHLKPAEPPLVEAGPPAVVAPADIAPDAAVSQDAAGLPEAAKGPGGIAASGPAPEPVSGEAGSPPDHDFTRLVARLSREDVGGRGRRILIRPVAEREEALEVARGLAEALVPQARVILVVVDGDEDQPVDDIPGFTDLITGEAKFADVIRSDPEDALHLVGPGTLVNEAITSNQDGVDLALAALGEAYEWVVCVLLGREVGALADVFAASVDSVVIASDLASDDPDLIEAYADARAAGARDLIVARARSEDVDAVAA